MKDSVPASAVKGHAFSRTVYKVMTNSDLTEGRGCESVSAVFDNELAATRYAKGKYVMGTDAPIRFEDASVVKLEDGTYYLLGQEILTQYRDPDEVRRCALAKLTLEERTLLGVK